MENEPNATIINADNTTDTHLQPNGVADNVSRHSSRVGSARSGRSKATSLREATAIDGATERKTSGSVRGSPKPDATISAERVASALAKSKPGSPAIPIIDTPSGEFDDDGVNQESGRIRPEIEAIVISSIKILLSIFLNDNYLCYI